MKIDRLKKGISNFTVFQSPPPPIAKSPFHAEIPLTKPSYQTLISPNRHITYSESVSIRNHPLIPSIYTHFATVFRLLIPLDAHHPLDSTPGCLKCLRSKDQRQDGAMPPRLLSYGPVETSGEGI